MSPALASELPRRMVWMSLALASQLPRRIGLSPSLAMVFVETDSVSE